MADCEVSSEGSCSSDTISPTPPTPKRSRRSPARKSSGKKSCSRRQQQREKHSHRGRKGKRKGKRKHVPSSSSASSSSHDSADSDSPDSNHITSKKNKKMTSQLSITNSQGEDVKKSALFDIFRRHYSALVSMTSTCVHTITDKLFSKNLISEDV